MKLQRGLRGALFFALSLLEAVSIPAVAKQKGGIEFHLATETARKSCTSTPEFRDFLENLTQWRPMIGELSLVVPEDFPEHCLRALSRALKAEKFTVKVVKQAGAKQVSIEGSLTDHAKVAAGGATDGAAGSTAAGAAAESTATAANGKSGEAKAGKLDDQPGANGAVEVGEDGKPVSKSNNHQTDKTAAANSKEPGEDRAKAGESLKVADGSSAGKPLGQTLSEETQSKDAKSPFADTNAAPADQLTGDGTQPVPDEAKPFFPTSDEIARWSLGIGPSYLMVTGTGISGTATGVNLAKFDGAFLLSSKIAFAGDFLTPLNGSANIPQAMITHFEGGYIFRGARSTLKKAEAVPLFSAQADLGLLYFSQSSPNGAAVVASQNANLISEVVAPYVALKAKRWLKKDMSASARYAFIPILPLSGTGLSLSQEFSAELEQEYGPYMGFLAINWGNYNVDYSDPTLGDLFATYLSLQVGIRCSF